MVVGVDVHVTTAPPFNPIHPYIGMVMDPADYIPFLGTNVSVNGLKRGVSDTGGMIIPLMLVSQTKQRLFQWPGRDQKDQSKLTLCYRIRG